MKLPQRWRVGLDNRCVLSLVIQNHIFIVFQFSSNRLSGENVYADGGSRFVTSLLI